MELNEIDVKIDSGQSRNYFEGPCKCDIESPDSTGHRVGFSKTVLHTTNYLLFLSFEAACFEYTRKVSK